MNMWSQLKILQHPATIRAILDGRGNQQPPLHVQIEPTEACNFRCRFCHWHDIERRSQLENFDFRGGRSLPISRMLALVDELAEIGVKAIAFTGAGDPGTYKHLGSVLTRIQVHGIQYAVTSNLAMPLSEETIAGLSAASWVRCSFNALSDEVYTTVQGPSVGAIRAREQQLHNLRRLNTLRQQAGRSGVAASFVVTHGNELDILSCCDILREVGCSSLSFRPDMPFEKGAAPTQYAATVLETLKEAGSRQTPSFRIFTNLERLDEGKSSEDPDLVCYYINHSTYIAASGDVYPCCYTRYNARYILGNILERSFKDLWYSEPRQQAYRSIHYNQCPPCHHGNTNSVLKSLYGDHPPDFFV